VLVDTTVWIDHLRRGNARLASLLESGEVESHPFVIGELACGSLKYREEILSLMDSLPKAIEADHHEVLTLVESRGLVGSGLGWIDAHLLASALLGRTTLWTLDRRLAEQARKLEVLFDPGNRLHTLREIQGLWRDRGDLASGITYVRRLREDRRLKRGSFR
jgi:predicted nucleic acid-binding protein